MPSGDAQRVWFPEMLSLLANKWSDSLSWDEYTTLCKDMTEYHKELKKKKNIKQAKMYCKNCNQYHDIDVSSIGIRSLLFALKKSNKINDSEFKILDKDWKKYQNKNQLDGYGNKKMN